MKMYFLGAIFSFLLSFQLLAQNAMPVKWDFSIEKADQENYNLVFTASIDKGWYVYSQDMEAEIGPIPTSFSFEQADNYKFIGKTEEIGDKIEQFDDYFDMNISKYANSVRFVQKIQNPSKAKSVSGSVDFMTCDDHKCLPPSSLDFTLNFE